MNNLEIKKPTTLNNIVSKIVSIDINTIMLIMILFVSSMTVYSQKTDSKHIAVILGGWEGNMVINESKSVGILWRFEKTKQGKLNGFMGPVSKGVADIPMQSIVVNDTLLSFEIHSEGSYLGKISKSGINGTWTSKSGRQINLYVARELSKQQISKRFSNDSKDANDVYINIKKADIDAIKIFLNEKDNDINKVYSKGYTLLCYAVKKDRSNKIAKYLLENGANPNIASNGISPLMYAIAYKNYDMVNELIKNNADIDFQNKKNETALMYAIGTKNVKSLKVLLNNKVNIKLEISKNYTAIDMAVEENIKEILEVLNIPYTGVSDGPYILKDETGHSVTWVSKNKIYTQKVNVNIAEIISLGDMTAKLWGYEAKEVTKLKYNGDFKIAAISDIHGQYDLLINLLKSNKIIDNDGLWSFGNGHFVVAGDMFDRGHDVTKVLWFLYDLEKQAKEKGGKLHVMLGNHDVMVLNGNLRSVHNKYNEIATILKRPFNSLFNKGSVLGDWLRTRPVVIVINGILFTHGGLHPDLVSKNMTINQINTVFKQQLIESELDNQRNDIGNYLHRGDGPIYYRGYFQGELATTKQIDDLLKHFDINNIIVGHTTHKQIETRYDGKVIVIDSNMKNGKSGEILLWEKGKFSRGTLSGKSLELK